MTSEDAREVFQYGYRIACRREKIRATVRHAARLAKSLLWWWMWAWCVSNMGDATLYGALNTTTGARQALTW